MEKELDISKIANEAFHIHKNVESEMRDMLSVILPAVKLAQKTRWSDDNEIEKTKTYLNIISKASYNMLRTLNNFSDFSALKNNEMPLNVSSCDIVALCRELVMTVSETVSKKKISFSLLTDSESKHVTCDCEKTERIILNILSNAIANTANNGSILLCLKDNDTSWELTVIDNGIGIDEENAKKFFEEYFQRECAYKRNFCGIGMGLYLAQEFAKLQKGSLHISSKGETGCVFTFKMPTICRDPKRLCEAVIPEYADYSFEQKVLVELSYLDGEKSESAED